MRDNTSFHFIPLKVKKQNGKTQFSISQSQ